MPEIKQQFTGGKMNKDVDERLVPNGEYRDAMNIQVSTSEGSDVGTAQNILGNKLVADLNFLKEGDVCVGSVADEKNDALYWFVAGDFTTDQQANLTTLDGTETEGISTAGDYILEYQNATTNVVFADIYYKEALMSGVAVFQFFDGTLTFPFNDHVFANGDLITSIATSTAVYSNLNLKVVSFAAGDIVVSLENPDSFPASYTASDKLAFFTDLTTTSTAKVVAFREKTLGVNSNNLITGVNILDDLLLWTDGATEPKKINIPRCKLGTNTNPLRGTQLIVNGIGKGIMKEEHVTVIKKGPAKPPGIVDISASRSGFTDGTTVFGGNSYDNFVDPSTGLNRSEGTDMWIIIGEDLTGASPDLLIGDVLRMNPSSLNQPDDFTARVIIKQIEPGPFNIPSFGTASSTQIAYRVTIASLSSEAGNYIEKHDFKLEKEGKSLFKRKLPRFACRYKYEDNEYSQVGPFSEVVFIPGAFDYHPKKAFNIGMTNKLEALTLRDFVTPSLPKDVVQIDLLYKEESAPNIYVIKSVNRGDETWEAPGTGFGLKGAYNVTTENIYQQLPSNQIIRPWDNVPKNALAQDIVGNRVVYGNYTQGYDISDITGETYSPLLSTSLDVREKNIDNKAHKSIKSLRAYNFGVVYGDKYGRETPVFTNNDAGFEVSKSSSPQSSAFTVSLQSPAPPWADYYKIFVKETSNEYYNLAMGRVYDASDGNVWISFPSVDRNKVDEDTYLVLKKGIEDKGAVQEEARYKIVSIKNEAPDYIKTEYTLLAEPNLDINGYALLGGSVTGGTATFNSPVEAPYPGHTSFSVKVNRWAGLYDPTAENMGLPGLEDLWNKRDGDDIYVSFSTLVKDAGTGAWYTRVSEKRKISEINKITAGTTEVYVVKFIDPIRPSESWITDGIANNFVGSSGQLKPHFYKKEVLNKPEFDGRFFVKILDDDIIRANIANPIPLEQGYKVDNSTSIFKLSDTNAPGVTTGTTGNLTSKLPEHWQSLLKFGGNTYDGKWFIDEAAFAGVQPDNSDHINDFIATEGNTELSDISSLNDTYIDNSGNTFFGPSGRSTGLVFKKGIHTGDYTNLTDPENDGGYDSTGSNMYLSLSYSALAPSVGNTGQSYHGSNWVHAANWNVGNPNNSFTSHEAGIVSSLSPGKLFRIKGDPQVYKITQSTKRRLYNWRGANIAHSLLNPVNNNGVKVARIQSQETGMLKEYNKRLNYLIRYEVLELTPGSGVPVDAVTGFPFGRLEDNDAIGGINAVTSGQLEFLSKFNTEIDPIISDNPAIFETEPKEDVGLDIYYEASGQLPTRLTVNNLGEFISIGATITTDGASTFADGTFVTKVIGNTVTLSSSILYSELQSIKLKFTNDDGTYFFAVPLEPNSAGSTNSIEIELEPDTVGLGWFNCWSFSNGVESNRIGDTYNKPFVRNGVKASTILLDAYEEEVRKYGLIYSGIYNSTSGVNNLNQFVAAEKITKDINPIYGSIQKLHAGWGQGGDLIALCEDRVLKIFANKDALYNADGNTNVTSTNNVLGQAIPYSGEYGISKNPESFASENYRAYFTDKVRSTVMRLSIDGLTPISNAGMRDWFRDNLQLNNTLIGSYDDRQEEYNLTLPALNNSVTFREDTRGWVSFKSFAPENAVSCASKYYTIKKGKLWKHHAEDMSRNTFYIEDVQTAVVGPHPTDGTMGKYFWVDRQSFVNLINNGWDGWSGSTTVHLKQYRSGELVFEGDVVMYGVGDTNSINSMVHGRKVSGAAEGNFLVGDSFTVEYMDSFYTNSKLSVVMNSSPSHIKSFKTINYEGSQSKVSQNLLDDQYYNLSSNNGWYVNLAATDQEEGSVAEFINKEGKWYNFIRGESIQHNIKGEISTNNNGEISFDPSSLAVQGLGVYGTAPVVVTGCTNPLATNFNPLATVDDGSCIIPTPETYLLAVVDAGAILTQGSGSTQFWTKLPAGNLDPQVFPATPSISHLYDATGALVTDGAVEIPAGSYSGTHKIRVLNTEAGSTDEVEYWSVAGATENPPNTYSGGNLPTGVEVYIYKDAQDVPGIVTFEVTFDGYNMPAADTILDINLHWSI